MWFISSLKHPWSCFPSHFCFLVIVILLSIVLLISLLMAAIRLPFLYSLRVVVSMHERCFQCLQVTFLPLFLIHTTCQHRLWDVMPHALSLVFLFFWSICLSSSLVHLRKGLKYLTSGTVQVFISLVRFQLESFVSNYYYHTFIIKSKSQSKTFI